VFDRADVAAALAERRRVVEAGRRLGNGGNERVHVGPPEHDPVVGPRGMEDHVDVAAAVEADSREANRPGECRLHEHRRGFARRVPV